ncbi:protein DETOXIFICATION 12-like, partial [Camellia sinensis]|uniref:protein DETOXIFICATION 12-like n=1 Tax=Camellia sinensis TaxID=4442 RepID=UPI001035778E
TRVSNELGAGNPQGARVAVFAVILLAVAETTVVSATLFACRRIFGYTFSNEKEVVDYVTAMAPLVCLSVIMDSIQGVLSGVARGSGWQHIGAYVNLGAFYLCGIPIAAILAFWELPIFWEVMGDGGYWVKVGIHWVNVEDNLLGMACALETLCGQAYGAQQYQKLGTQTYTAIFSLVIFCLPLSILWIFMGKILIFIGQDPLISHEVGKFITWLVPALFAYAILQPLVRYFQMQSLTLPMLISSCVTLAFLIPLYWVLVFKSGLDNLGGALAIDISIWLNVIFLVLYMKYSSSCEKTRVPISMEVLRGVGEFFSFAIPSAVMICLAWWSFELLILLSGLLPNPQLETSVLSVWYVLYHNTSSTKRLNWLNSLYHIIVNEFVNLKVWVSNVTEFTRVSNELGAGNPQGARVAVFAVMLLAVAETTVVSATLFACRRIFGYTFSNEKEVVDYVTAMAPLVCLSVIMDSIQGVLSGVARGCGWQHIGAYANLGAFYLCGIPIAAILAFWVQLRGKGLWIGIQAGAFVQTIMLAIITRSTNWDKQATQARQRIFDGKSSTDDGLK